MLGARRPWAAALAIAIAATGCGSGPTPPPPPPPPPPPGGSAALQLLASGVPATVARLVVEVTATDMPSPSVVTITPSGGTGSGTITVPVGAARTLTFRAYDRADVETHRGSTRMDVQAGVNPTISISLTPLQGQQPIEVRVEGLIITITPASVTMNVDQIAKLQAVITTSAGGAVSVAPGDIRWATLQPHVATVGSTGEVLGVAPGSATIVAVYAGVGGTASITVKAAAASVGSVTTRRCAGWAAGIASQLQPILDAGCFSRSWGRQIASSESIVGLRRAHPHPELLA